MKPLSPHEMVAMAAYSCFEHKSSKHLCIDSTCCFCEHHGECLFWATLSLRPVLHLSPSCVSQETGTFMFMALDSRGDERLLFGCNWTLQLLRAA